MIDAHVHIFSTIRGFSGHGMIHSLGYGRIRTGTGEERQVLDPSFVENTSPPELLLRYMDSQNVDHAVMMQSGFFGEQNDYAMEAQRKWPDRFTAVCTYDPYGARAPEQLRRITDGLGCRIIKLQCSDEYGLSGIHLDLNYTDDCFYRLMENAQNADLTVVFDTGNPGTAGYQPDRMRELFTRYSDVQIVVAHLGLPPGKKTAPSQEAAWREMFALGDLPNVVFDISSLVGLQGDDYPYPAARDYIRQAIDRLGAEKLIFGTDYPGILTKCTYRQAWAYIREYCGFLTEEQTKLIFRENAVRIYKIKCRA